MISRDVVITNTSGLHARPATFFIQKANSYSCSIWIEKDDRKVNAKSLLGVLSLGIAKGMTVTLKKPLSRSRVVPKPLRLQVWFHHLKVLSLKQQKYISKIKLPNI